MIEIYVEAGSEVLMWPNIISGSIAAIVGALIGGIFLWRVTKKSNTASLKAAKAAEESLKLQQNKFEKEIEQLNEIRKKRTVDYVQPMLLQLNHEMNDIISYLNGSQYKALELVHRFCDNPKLGLEQFDKAELAHLEAFTRGHSKYMRSPLDAMQMIAATVNEGIVDSALFDKVFRRKFIGEVKMLELFILVMNSGKPIENQVYGPLLSFSFPERYS